MSVIGGIIIETLRIEWVTRNRTSRLRREGAIDLLRKVRGRLNTKHVMYIAVHCTCVVILAFGNRRRRGSVRHQREGCRVYRGASVRMCMVYMLNVCVCVRRYVFRCFVSLFDLVNGCHFPALQWSSESLRRTNLKPTTKIESNRIATNHTARGISQHERDTKAIQ